MPAKVAHIEYDPNRTARIALLHYADGEKAYIVAPEKLKQGDMLASTFAEFSKQSEHLFRALISERDQFMAAMLRQGADIPNRPLKVLAVLGAGHLEGIAKQLDERIAKTT